MKLFLDSSVLLAACGRPLGASRALFGLMDASGWTLLTSAYVLREVGRNISRIGPHAAGEWGHLRRLLMPVPDVLVFDWPVVFEAGKDRPVLFTAAACADVLLTLDRADFGPLMGTGFYGLLVSKPGDFLVGQRAAGRL